MDPKDFPAFPVDTSRGSDGEYGHQTGNHNWQFPGMTMRDYFAAKAMQAIIAGNDADQASLGIGAAMDAYHVADAMMKARTE